MSLISDLIPVVDGARKIAEDIGIRIHEINMVHLDWPIAKGIGTPAVTKERIDPQPKVLKYMTQQHVQTGGSAIEADFEISKISKVYELEKLMGEDLTDKQEFFWEISGVLYTPVGYQERALGWNIYVRRTNRCVSTQ